MQKVRILILGHGKHGKTTAAQYIARQTGLKLIGTSAYCAHKIVYPLMRHMYPNATQCFKDRSNHRLFWRDTIRGYNSPDPARVSRELRALCDIQVGTRCHIEYGASRYLFDHTLWVDGSGRKPLDDSMTVTFDPECMRCIDNNAELHITFLQLDRFIDTYIR